LEETGYFQKWGGDLLRLCMMVFSGHGPSYQNRATTAALISDERWVGAGLLKIHLVVIKLVCSSDEFLASQDWKQI
jgi:hypothetical protein